MIHNHPSGDPTPSEEDKYATKQIEKAGELIGVKLHDHIIIGQGKYASVFDEKVRDACAIDRPQFMVAEFDDRERER